MSDKPLVISRKTAIERLVQSELDSIKGQFGDDYLREIIRDGGPVGMANLSNDDLEEEYYQHFSQDAIVLGKYLKNSKRDTGIKGYQLVNYCNQLDLNLENDEVYAQARKELEEFLQSFEAEKED